MKKTKKQASTWVHLNEIDRDEPKAEITLAAVLAFRNGLGWLLKGDKKGGTILHTMIYRSMLDLDHLARILDAENKRSTLSFRYVIKPADKKSAVKMAREAMKSGQWKRQP